MFLISRAVSICVAYINFIALLLYEVKITFHGVCAYQGIDITDTIAQAGYEHGAASALFCESAAPAVARCRSSGDGSG